MKDVTEELSQTARAFVLQVVTDAQEAIKQRDDLLAALEGIVPLVEGEWPEGHGEAQPILDAARAAIAAAKGAV